MSESSGDESTPVVGIFYDSFTSVAGSIAKSKEATVEQTVANLAGAIVKKINSNFSVVPPLSLPKDMLIHYYPPLTGKADIHIFGAADGVVFATNAVVASTVAVRADGSVAAVNEWS